MNYAPWCCNSMQPQNTLQMFADHFGPRRTIPWEPSFREYCNHKGSCTLFRPYLTITAEISSLSFVRVFTRQLVVSSLSKGIQAHLIFTRALVLTGLELATSCTQNERLIDWANLTSLTKNYNLKVYWKEIYQLLLLYEFYGRKCKKILPLKKKKVLY